MNKIYIEITKKENKFRETAKRYTTDKNEVDEVVQELFLYFLQMNANTLKKMYDTDGILGVTRYGCMIIKRNLTCKNNKYYYKIKKYYTRISSIYETDQTYEWLETSKRIENIPEELTIDNYYNLEIIDKELDKMYWYDRDVFKLYYYEGNTLDSLADKTKISRNSLFTTIKKVREELKRIINERKKK